MVNLYARDAARVETCENAVIIHALLQFSDLMPNDTWQGLESKRILGALIHDLFPQLIGDFGCQLISAMIERGMPKNDAICETLLILFNRSTWSNLINDLNELEKGKPLRDIILKEFNSYKKGIAKLASSLIIVENGKVFPVQYEKEVYIQTKINYHFNIAGKIDLLIHYKDKTLVVDLKTGNKSLTHLKQVQLYVEMLKKELPHTNLIGQVWYVRKREPRKVNLHPNKEPMLPKIKSTLNKIEKITSISQLIREKRTKNECYACKLCDLALQLLQFNLPSFTNEIAQKNFTLDHFFSTRKIHELESNINLFVGEKEIG